MAEVRFNYGDKFTQTTNTNTGIGSTIPTSTLDVDGTVKVSGVSTFSDDIFVGVGATVGFGTTAYFRDNAKAVFGDNENLAIYFNGNNSVIEDQGSGNTILSTNGNGVFITKNNGSAPIADFRTDESVILYHDGDEKFRTTGVGITVFGDIIVPDVGARTSRVGLGTTNPSGIKT